MTFDFTPVVIPNQPAFAAEVEALINQYQGLDEHIMEAIRREGRVYESHSSERVHELGTGIERLHDVMPNALNCLRLFAEEPTVGGQYEVIHTYWRRQGFSEDAGQLIDNAAREFHDPEIKAQLQAFGRQLHEVFHQAERCRQAVGQHSAAIASEDRGGQIKK